MNLIEKWKIRETKKKLREENIRLKAEIEAHMKTPYPVCTVERNVQKVCAKWTKPETQRNIPSDIVKDELLRKLADSLSNFVEYDFATDRYGNITYIATLYLATGDRRYGRHE